MKRTLALTLTLVLCLGLCTPALAEEVYIETVCPPAQLPEADGVYIVDGQPVETVPAGTVPELKNIADEPQEVQDFLYELYRDGDLTQENTDYDLSYFEDYEYVSPYEDYIKAHPEEIAALDADALIAQWGYHDMTAEEAFMEDYADYGETLDEAVKDRYIQMRLLVQEDARMAEEYREELPEAWADFDADAYFQTTYDWDKAEYMAWYCLRSQEEFVDDMFTDYIEYDYDVWDDDYDWDEPAGESTLTLMVNGVDSDVAVEVGEGTTYADADALRTILGDQAVAADATGSIAIRAAAEAAGWDVVWYDGGWWGEDREVQLWNKELFLAEVEPQIASYRQLWDAIAGLSKRVLEAETPQRQQEEGTLTFTRFNTLDGNETYTAKYRAETVYQKGVADITLEFDAALLLELLPTDIRDFLTMSPDVDALGQLKQLFSPFKAEIILDYNQSAIAYNVPLLGLMGEDGWHTDHIDFSALKPGADYGETLYDSMVEYAQWMGGASAREIVVEPVLAAAQLFAGPDNVKKTGSTLTWTIETDKLNAALSKLVGDGDEQFSFYKKCDLTMTISEDGTFDLTYALRPDLEGTAAADSADLVGGFASDFDLSLASRFDGKRGTLTGKLHQMNYGIFELSAQTSVRASDHAPRQIKDVEPLRVEPTPGTVLTAAF